MDHGGGRKRKPSCGKPRSGSTMEDDDRELLRRLFVAATALSETAQEAAVAGQSSTLAAPDYADAAQRLLAAARGVAALAGAAAVIARSAGEGARTGRESYS